MTRIGSVTPHTKHITPMVITNPSAMQVDSSTNEATAEQLTSEAQAEVTDVAVLTLARIPLVNRTDRNPDLCIVRETKRARSVRVAHNVAPDNH